ncbi:MAG: helix-turn-helix domain-containing protein [Flavobacteriales bacterium]|nr:helix-turn-helix domain-containing protein [Flavobacteriales bacterium]
MEKPNLSFDQLPQLIHDQGRQIEELTKLVLQALADKSEQEPDVPNMNIHEAAEFLKLKVATVYSKVSKGELPYMKRGNRLYFSKKDIILYLRQTRNQTKEEINAQACAYLAKHKR